MVGKSMKWFKQRSNGIGLSFYSTVETDDKTAKLEHGDPRQKEYMDVGRAQLVPGLMEE